MFLSQIQQEDGSRAVVAREGEAAHLVLSTASTRDLALAAITAGHDLRAEVARRGLGAAVDLGALLDAGRLLLPLDHPDPAHLHLTGTGLTHLGSASTRHSMHASAEQDSLTDSMKMFRMGLEGGKPRAGEIGVQPEWFYKGNGFHAVAPESDLISPSFALDAGEEPEIAGLYIIGPQGDPYRLGFALGNEFSDHITERGNYLWLAHSKLRPASFGPEMLIGPLPAHLEGMSRIWRDGVKLWEKPFLSGEANMSHSLANLEHHHFKYPIFRQPGDVHVHFFGTATLSFADGIRCQSGDIWEIDLQELGLPLRNRLRQASPPTQITTVGSL